jgi:DNA-binding GntR family transcriptional regulator
MTVPLDTAYITAENNLAASDEQAIRQIVARLNHALDAADYPLYLRESSKFILRLSNFKRGLLVPHC